jgi:Cytochrome c7 and related cytochrome c
MIRIRSRHGLVPGIVILAACLAAGVASSAPPHEKGKAAIPNAARAPEKEFAVPTPPFTPGIFPCTECHKEMKPNPTRRELKDEHTNIVLNHAQGQRWCLDCHDVSNRDKLRLVSGEKIGFEESFRLCGQCHGDKFRDWKVGVHGKRTGMWNGEKQYLLCVHCHNPHDPQYKPIPPMPPPARPETIKK